MAGIDAFGTTLGIGTPTPVTVADITSIDVLDVKVDAIDVSSHDSTDKWSEFIAGMKDGGEVSLDLNYDPAAHATLFGLLGTEEDFTITLTDISSAEVTFAAFVSSFKAQAPYDDKLSATVTLKVTGAVSVA